MMKKFKLYPTRAMADKYMTSTPVIYAVCAGTIFVFASLAFIAYDVLIRRRQSKVMTSAKRTNDIVSSLFPENVRHRLYERVSSVDTAADALHRGVTRLPGLPSSSTTDTNVFGSEPIADLFPHTTVMFLDIANFTAWSSEREPSQVFTLLENLYHCFDEIGRRLGIFKVETIGDSYVAAAGLPKARNDHAVGGSRRAIFFAFLVAPLLTIHRLIFVSNDSVCA
jgi:Adenylate and Guanylate cyclase catalytic domain